KAMTALGGTQRVGNLLGPMIGAGLMLVCPIWSVLALAGLAAVAAIVIMALPVARLPRFVGLQQRAQSAHPAAAVGGPGSKPGRAGRQPLDVHLRSVVLVGITIITLAAARAAQPVVIELWGVEIGLHKSSIALVIAFVAGLELIVMSLGAYIKDHLGRIATLV